MGLAMLDDRSTLTGYECDSRVYREVPGWCSAEMYSVSPRSLISSLCQVDHNSVHRMMRWKYIGSRPVQAQLGLEGFA